MEQCPHPSEKPTQRLQPHLLTFQEQRLRLWKVHYGEFTESSGTKFLVLMQFINHWMYNHRDQVTVSDTGTVVRLPSYREVHKGHPISIYWMGPPLTAEGKAFIKTFIGSRFTKGTFWLIDVLNTPSNCEKSTSLQITWKKSLIVYRSKKLRHV